MEQKVIEVKRKPEDTAFLSQAMPCNPLPFLNRMSELVKEYGTEAAQTDEYKANMWILLCQSYGQLFRVDSYDEYVNLKNSLT